MDIQPIFPEVEVARLGELIGQARRVAITCHISPDGDALGSSLGLADVLARMGKTVHVVTPDMPPKVFDYLPGFDEIVVGSMSTDMAQGLIANCDLLFCLDFNDFKRIDRLGAVAASTKARKVMIDHHLYPSLDCDLAFSDPSKSSTSLLVYLLLHQLGLSPMVDRESGTCLMTGLITDTGNFSYSSLDPQLYLVTAELVALGVDKDMINRRVFRNYSLDRLRLNVYALSQHLTVYPEWGAAVVALSDADLKAFNYQKGDTEGLVNVPLGIPGVDVSVFVREESGRDKVKISVRSLDDYPADRFCSDFFGGGGHHNAAGGEYAGTLPEAVEAIAKALEVYSTYEFNKTKQ